MPASAETLPGGNVVSACSGVSLPRSTVTSLVTPIVLAGVTPVQNGVNSILHAPLLATALGALGGTTVNVDLTSSVAQVNSGAPITLQVLADDGTVLSPSSACYSRASKFTLTSPAGLSIGGNVISGLGDANAAATSAGEINSIAFGNGAATATSATRSIAIGTAATIGSSGSGGIALGNLAQVAAANGVAIGNGAQATAANSIALGASSTATRGVRTNYTGYALATPQTSAGEVSVGSTGAERQITNVAAGSSGTDAVNVAQLTAVGGRLDSLASLAVVYDSTALGRITLGGVAGTSIANLAAGTISAGSTEAVNGSQLYATNQSLATNAVNIAATGTQVLALNNGGAGILRYSNAVSPTVSNGGIASNDVALTTSLGGSVALHNLTAGTLSAGSTDAVNGGQLYATNQSVATNTANIATTGTQVLSLNNGGAGILRYSNAGTPTLSNGGISSNDVTLTTSLGGSVALHNLTAGTLSAGSTDAVNGGQLYATNQLVAANTSAITGLDGRVTANTAGIVATNGLLTSLASNAAALSAAISNGGVGPVQYANSGSPFISNGGVPTNDLTLIGASSGPVSLHNVALGTISLGSTDAINGGQFARLGTQVASAFGSFTYNPQTNSLGGNFTYGGNHYASVQDALNAVAISSGTIGSTAGMSLMYFHTNSTEADSNASGINSTAIGALAVSAGMQSVAMGVGAIANSQDSVAIGTGATAQSGKAVAIGLGNIASGDGAVSIGDPNLAMGDGAVALGKDNSATGVGAIALGNVNVTNGDGAAAIGSSNNATGRGTVAIGFANSASGISTITLGSNNVISGDYSVAIGNGITASASNTLAIGQSVQATATNATAIGNNAAAIADDSIAVGVSAQATGAIAGAIGTRAQATNMFSLAIGPDAHAYAIAGTAVGVGAAVTGFASVALGSGAVANADNSVAVGSAVEAIRGENHNYFAFGIGAGQESNGEIAFAQTLSYIDPRTGLPSTTGNRQLTGVAAGSADTDAVNVSQLRAVSGRLGTAIASGLGGGSTYDAVAGAVTQPSYTIGGASYSSVGDALQALAMQGTGQAPSTGSGGSNPAPVNSNPQAASGNAVAYDGSAQDTVTLASGGTRITNVGAGSVAPGSTDAVNGSQLAAVNAKADTNAAAVSTLASQVDRGAVGTVQYSQQATPAVPDGGIRTNDVTLVGANATRAVGLHNVADGTVAAGSTDAVNGGQLAATDQRALAAQATATSAIAMSRNAVQYDDASHGATTLGGAGATTPVALHNLANGTQAYDAVNLGQLADAAGAALKQSNAYTDSAVRGLRFDLATVRKDAAAGTAGAMALAGLPQPYEAGRGMIAVGVGAFRGETAIAFGASKAFADEHTVMKLGATYNSRGDVGFNAGAGYQF